MQPTLLRLGFYALEKKLMPIGGRRYWKSKVDLAETQEREFDLLSLALSYCLELL